MKILLVALLAVFMLGCTAIKVQPVNNVKQIQHICIEENPLVKVKDFLSVLDDTIQNNLITTEIIRKGNKAHQCEYRVTYTALRSWDFVPYMYRAEIRLYHRFKRIGYAEYRLRLKGGFSLFKWQGTKAKITPIINRLLAEKNTVNTN